MHLIFENRWAILLVLEVLAWVSTFLVFYARYRLRSPFWFKAGAVLLVATGVIPQILLGLVNYHIAGEIDLFTLIIAILIVYGLTVGKNHMKKLDAWAQARFSPRDEQ